MDDAAWMPYSSSSPFYDIKSTCVFRFGLETITKSLHTLLNCQLSLSFIQPSLAYTHIHTQYRCLCCYTHLIFHIEMSIFNVVFVILFLSYCRNLLFWMLSGGGWWVFSFGYIYHHHQHTENTIKVYFYCHYVRLRVSITLSMRVYVCVCADYSLEI